MPHAEKIRLSVPGTNHVFELVGCQRNGVAWLNIFSCGIRPDATERDRALKAVRWRRGH